MHVAKDNSILGDVRAFSRAWHRLHVFTSSSDWFIGLFPTVVIGQSNYFGFTTLNWKPLYQIQSEPNTKTDITYICNLVASIGFLAKCNAVLRTMVLLLCSISDHCNERYWGIPVRLFDTAIERQLFSSTVYYAVQGEILVSPFIWKVFSGAFLWYCFLCCTRSF